MIVDGRPLVTNAGRDLSGVWDDFRADVAGKFRGDLLKAVKREASRLPIMAQFGTEDPAGHSVRWYGSGDAAARTTASQSAGANGIDAAPPPGDSEPDYAGEAHRVSQIAYLTLVCGVDGTDASDGARFVRWSREQLDHEKEGWQGVVIDLSSLPIGAALRALDLIEAPKGL